MNLGDIKPARGAVHRRKRRGIGTGSGHGGTCGRGNKGQRARTGKGKIHIYFEGGQLPLHRRVPKLGFTPFGRVAYQVVNVGDLADAGFAAGAKVSPGALKERGLVRHSEGPIKLLANGEIAVALVVEVDAASEAARRKVEAAGGRVSERTAAGGQTPGGPAELEPSTI